MATDIRIRKVPGRWVVRSDGAILAETSGALELEDGSRAPVIFFPQSDVAMAFLDAGGRDTRRVGGATRLALAGLSATTPDVAWIVDAPVPGAERLAGHVAFDSEKVTVERI